MLRRSLVLADLEVQEREWIKNNPGFLVLLHPVYLIIARAVLSA